MRINYCYDETAKQEHKQKLARFTRKLAKALPIGYKLTFSFCAGGIAVWGENWVKITRDDLPVVELILAYDYSIARQWDGRYSGRNINVDHLAVPNLADVVVSLAVQPFVRF